MTVRYKVYQYVNRCDLFSFQTFTLKKPAVNLGSRYGAGSKLTCISNCSTAGGYIGNEVPITGYCTDYSTAMSLTVSQRSDIVNLTVGAYFIATFTTIGGWQTLALGSSSGWSLSVTIDLRPRSDTGLINTPPVATCISFISIPVNVQQKIPIPILDADNDYIRCRFASGSSECYNTCPPGSLPAGTSISSSCVLTITGPTAGVYYLVALQVEDFISNTSTSRLSSVPIQFLIYVYSALTCSLKPLLISSFEAGSCQGAQVGQTLTIEFIVINQCGSGRTISDIATLSFPIVLKGALIQNATNTSLWTMKITWVPTANEVGSQVFCAVAIDNTSVQSDQLCTTIFVGLNSASTCPGATNATTAMTSVTTHLTSLEKPKVSIHWPLIVSLSLLVLLLALCCSICCWLYFLSQRQRRRRSTDNMPEVGRKNPNTTARLLKQFTRNQSCEHKVGISATSNSSRSFIVMDKLDQQEIASHVTSKAGSEIISKKLTNVRSPTVATTNRMKSVSVKKISRHTISPINPKIQSTRYNRDLSNISVTTATRSAVKESTMAHLNCRLDTVHARVGTKTN